MKKGRPFAGPAQIASVSQRLFAVAEQLEQHHEHVDKVQIKAQRAHDGGFAQPFGVGVFVHEQTCCGGNNSELNQRGSWNCGILHV